jgi:hypothetical protein
MKKINVKIIYALILICILVFLMIMVPKFYIEKKIIKKYYENYSNEYFKLAFDSVNKLIKNRKLTSKILSDHNIYDEKYYSEWENLTKKYLSEDIFTDIYIFDKNEKCIYSSNKSFLEKSYNETILNFNEKFINPNAKEVFYFKKIKSIGGVIKKENTKNNSNGIFLWTKNVKKIEPNFAKKNGTGELYFMDKNGKIIIPTNYTKKLNFNYSECISNKTTIGKDIIKCEEILIGGIYLFYFIENNEIFVNHNFLKRSTYLLISELIFILIFISLFYLSGRYK